MYSTGNMYTAKLPIAVVLLRHTGDVSLYGLVLSPSYDNKSYDP